MDKEIVARGPGVFDELLSYSKIVFRICLGFSANPHVAEELYQEVYLKAWSDLGSLRNKDSAKTWLLKIARNTSLNHLRKKRSDGRLYSEGEFPLVERNTPEAVVLRKEQRQILKDAVRRLPKKYRAVFVLREYGQLSYEEIAGTLGVKTGTVMSRLNRARRAISDRLKERGYGRQGTGK